jgi:outer membrane lipoprotein carrier protein
MASFLFLLVFFSAAGIPLAGDSATSRIVKLLESRYAASRSIRATFEERYFENGRLIRAESGIVRFQRPGKMRWEYKVPESKIFLSDGRTIWLYIPADRTAMRSSVRESPDWRTPFALLTRSPRLSRLCESVVPGEKNEVVAAGNQVLHCRLRGASRDATAEDEILLEISPQSGELSRVKIMQSGGTGIEFFFAGWQEDSKLNDSSFRFVPPPGVAIVNAPITEFRAESRAR